MSSPAHATLVVVALLGAIAVGAWLARRWASRRARTPELDAAREEARDAVAGADQVDEMGEAAAQAVGTVDEAHARDADAAERERDLLAAIANEAPAAEPDSAPAPRIEALDRLEARDQ